ncbi:MAG TPA: YsnF/AvaK domain-containing protein [Paucimonas sp.]|nr:YsnF/AvaK domain-containing protein [Paucimonas sp.]
MPVREEEIAIGTRQVETGAGIRVRKTVVEHSQRIDELLQREEIQVRRIPVDRTLGAEEAPSSRYEGDTLIVPVLEEILVVEKRLRIKEEWHISKIVRQEPHSETVALKSEEVAIRRFDERDDDGAGGADTGSSTDPA